MLLPENNNNQTSGNNAPTGQHILSDSLDANIDLMHNLFRDDDTMMIRYIENQNTRFYVAYNDCLIDPILINEHIIAPLMSYTKKDDKYQLIDFLINEILLINHIKKSNDVNEIVENLTTGNTILFMQGCPEALICDTKKYKDRTIEEPENERTLSGPREGFIESINVNLSLIRKRFKTNNLKMKYVTLGRQTKTRICICYLDNIINKQLLNELYKRLSQIDIDGVLDSNYISELIRDSGATPFEVVGHTERPDIVAANLLEGRVAIFVDGSPVVLTLPYLFLENFQNDEDYYLNFFYASFSRLLRYLGFFITIAVPAFYVSIVAFQREMLPSTLLISIAIERQGVPLPASLEAFIMLIIFDILRETGIRMPANIGQTLSIVGALVLGEAAVEARLISAPMIIIVAITGITNLLVPRLRAPVILLRYLFLALAAIFGIYGVVFGFSWIMIHIINLRSLTVPQFIPISSLNSEEFKDFFVRQPMWQLKKRPNILTSNKTRIK